MKLKGILKEFENKAQRIGRDVIDRLRQIGETLLVAVAIQGVGEDKPKFVGEIEDYTK